MTACVTNIGLNLQILCARGGASVNITILITHRRMLLCMYTYVCMYMYVCTYVCMYIVWLYLCTYNIM